jgi:hypothetical protein
MLWWNKTNKERMLTSALRIKCKPMVNVGKLIRESGGVQA